MRIFQNDFRQLAYERERFALIVLRLKRVMGQERNRCDEQQDSGAKNLLH